MIEIIIFALLIFGSGFFSGWNLGKVRGMQDAIDIFEEKIDTIEKRMK